MNLSQPLILGPRHIALLEACWRYRCPTALDCRQLLRMKSLPHVRRLLGQLCGGEDYAERQYLYRVPLPQMHPGGTEHAYFLGSRGREFLARELGLRADWPRRPGNARQLSLGTLLHDLTLARFLIALLTTCDAQGDLHLSDEQIRTQYELGTDLLSTQASHHRTAQEASMKVVPDAWVNVEVVRDGTRAFMPLLIEIDRGTTYAPALRARLLSRLGYISPGGPYANIFGTEAVTVVYVTTAGERRRDTLARLTAEVLEAEKREDWAEVFLFGETSFATMYEEAHSLLAEKKWYPPYSSSPVGLFG